MCRTSVTDLLYILLTTKEFFKYYENYKIEYRSYIKRSFIRNYFKVRYIYPYFSTPKIKFLIFKSNIVKKLNMITKFQIRYHLVDIKRNIS